MAGKNVLGSELATCGTDPLTGFYRDGCCNTGAEDVGNAMRSNASGIGVRLAVRVGSRWTVRETYRGASGPGQSLQPWSFGLGGASRADFVAMDWSDGVFQTELGLEPGKLHRIAETQRQLSSCPVLFAWDGEKYAFVSDLLGVGGIGFALAPGKYSTPRPWENFLLPQGLLQAQDGRYRLKIGEPMEEVAYLDAARLLTYDLPPGWQMVLDERMGTGAPEPTGEPRFYRHEALSLRAVNDQRENVTDLIAQADGKAAPVVLASVYYLFMPGGSVSGFYLLAWTVMLYLGWTMMLLPYATWGAELSPFYHQRSRVFAWRESFFLLGTIFATGVSAGIGFADQAHSATVLIVVGWGVILMLPTALALTLWRVPELPPRAHRPAPLGWRNGLIVLQHNQPFRRLIAAYLLMGIGNGLPATLFLLFSEHVVERPDAGGTFLFVFFLAAVVGMPFWLRLSYHIGKHRAWAAAMTWGCCAFVWVPFVVGPGDYWLFITFCVVAGLSLGADMMLPYAMQADVVDQDTVDSGDQRTGVYFGLWNMATKLALALAVGFGFPLLDAAGFQADGDNSEIAIWALALLYGFVPVCVKLVAIAIVWNYPLDERRQALLRDIIDEGAVGATRPGHRK